MPNAAAQTIEARTVEAQVNYLIDTGVKPVNETGPGDVRVIRHTGQHDRRTVAIHDGRPDRARFHLDEAGFELAGHLITVGRDSPARRRRRVSTRVY